MKGINTKSLSKLWPSLVRRYFLEFKDNFTTSSLILNSLENQLLKEMRSLMFISVSY